MTDGKHDSENGTFPLNHVILGGKYLYEIDDYIMVLKTPDEETLRKGYIYKSKAIQSSELLFSFNIPYSTIQF